MNYLIAGIIGLVSGITSGLFGVGGGIVMVPAMMQFMGMDVKKAVGTSLLVIIPTAIVGSYKHFTQGNVSWNTGLSIAPMAIIGSYLGAWWTIQLSSPALKQAFGGFLVLVGLKLLLGK